jgi:hypothetical protein
VLNSKFVFGNCKSPEVLGECLFLVADLDCEFLFGLDTARLFIESNLHSHLSDKNTNAQIINTQNGYIVTLVKRNAPSG